MGVVIDTGLAAPAAANDDAAREKAAAAPRVERTASRVLPRLLMAPAVATLMLWMLVPLVMTIYFSFIRYNLMQPEAIGIAVGQQMSAALSGKVSVDQALKTSQNAAEREMKKAGYYK